MTYALENAKVKMAIVMRFVDTAEMIKQKLERIRNACSVCLQSGSSVGYEYVYDLLNKSIEARRSEDDTNKIYVVVKRTQEEIIVILPYHIASIIRSDKSPPRVIPDFDFVLFNGVLREKQKTDAKKIFEALLLKGFCFFMAYPGYGKTIIMAYIISLLRQKAIILVPTTSLSSQTTTALKERLPGLKIHEVDVDRKIPEDADVVVSFIRRLDATPEVMVRFGTVVFDEVHMLTTPQGIPTMLSTRPRHLLAVTATEGDRKEITECFVGKCEIQSLSDKRWSICFPKVRSGLQGDYSSVEGYTNAMGDLSKSELFTNTIARMIRYFCGRSRRVIVITMRRDMSEILYNLLDGLTVSLLAPETPKCGNSDVIIGTHKYIGTGFDLSNFIENFDGICASVMIFLGSIKNATLMYQSSGRAFRSEAPIAIYPQIVELAVSKSHTASLRSSVKGLDGCQVLDDYARFLEFFNELPR